MLNFSASLSLSCLLISFFEQAGACDSCLGVVDVLTGYEGISLLHLTWRIIHKVEQAGVLGSDTLYNQSGLG